ncbi:MAG: NAD(P)/FAD-dependent oxidoreductase, partial [Candidatus Methanomethylophilus sp.]|nr:NAD(P)/FAD-dependent oxidoreductase [Methanomethylophilus sp.]
VGIVPDPTWIRGDMKGAILKSPDRTTFQLDESKAGAEVGYVLERHLFDKAIVRDGIAAGAKVMMRTSATDVIRDKDGKLIGVKAIEYGEPIEIYCDCIVGADGYESQVGRWAGIDTKLKLSDIDSCIQYRMVNADVAPDYCEFIIGSEAPGGYIWIFPKGNGVANVGIGVIGTEAKKRPGLAK